MHTADSQFAHWLSWFVDPESHRAKAPFILPNQWVAATNGRVGVAIPFTEGVNVCEVNPTLPARLCKILGAPSVHEQTFPREKILSMFGECDHPKAGPCSYCNGTGKVAHNCNCDFCDEDTKACDCEGEPSVTDPEKRPCALWGNAFDANLIAYVMEHAQAANEYTLRVVAIPEVVLVIVTPAWSAMVAGIEAKKKPTELIEIQPKGT